MAETILYQINFIRKCRSIKSGRISEASQKTIVHMHPGGIDKRVTRLCMDMIIKGCNLSRQNPVQITRVNCYNMKQANKLYSQGAISLATYFGGPVAAGILIRKNCIELGKDKQGLNALFFGILSTILIFFGIFQIPEHIIDKVPNVLIPLIYTGFIYLIVENIQGEDLKKHKEAEGAFYSNWRAAGIGAIFTIITLGGIFAYAYLEAVDWDVQSYDEGLTRFHENEEAALELFELIEISSKQEIIGFIEDTGIPKWQESIEIFAGLNNIENIPVEATKQNNLLSEYCELRIEAYELISKAVRLETSEFDLEIIRINNRIDQLIEKL